LASRVLLGLAANMHSLLVHFIAMLPVIGSAVGATGANDGEVFIQGAGKRYHLFSPNTGLKGTATKT